MPKEKLPNGLELDAIAFRNRLAPQLIDLGCASITGSRLAPLIDSCLEPGTNYRSYFPLNEAPRLRTFVEKYLAEVVIPTDERSGTDPVYRIVHALGSEANFLRTAGQLWRTFAALSPTQHLSYDRETAELGLVDLLAEATDSVALIPSVAFHEHRTICEDFYSDLSSRGHAAPLLQAVLKEFEPETYPIWLRTLRTSRPPLDKEWGQFRQNAIMALFKKRLADIPVPPERIDQLALQLVRDHEQIIQKKSGKPPTAVESSSLGDTTAAPKDLKEKKARELMHSAVDQMTYEQLQNLLVPFGVILDALNSQSTK